MTAYQQKLKYLEKCKAFYLANNRPAQTKSIEGRIQAVLHQHSNICQDAMLAEAGVEDEIRF